MNSKYSRPAQADNGTYCGLTAGQHVVCVSLPSPLDVQLIVTRGGTANMPVIGRVYTIREVYVTPARGMLCVRLVEVRNKPISSKRGLREPGFASFRFRPLQKLTPEMFMSTDAPVKQGEPA